MADTVSTIHVCKSQAACQWCCENCSRIHESNEQAAAAAGAPVLSFFKIMTDSMVHGKPNSWMQLPTSLVRRCGGALGPVILKGPSGQEWKVDMSGIRDDSIGFRRGWKAFSCHHKLEKGDVLFFRKTADSCFYVQIFDKNGCEKDTTSANNSTSNCKPQRPAEKRKGLELLSCKDIKRFKKAATSEIQTRLCNAYSKRLRSKNCEKREANECSNVLRGSMVHEEAVKKDFDDSCMFSDEAKLFYNSTPTCINEDIGRPLTEHVVHTLSSGTQSDSSEQIPERAEIQYSDEINNSIDQKKPKMQQICHAGDKIKSSLSKNQALYLQRAIISQRRPVTDLEKQKTLEEAQAHKSRRPFTRVIMRGSHVYRGFKLTLPLPFVTNWFPTNSARITFLDSTGTKFCFKWLGSRRRNNPSLSGNWRKFALDHGLEEDDICIFELVSKIPIVLRVHIYRVVEPVNRVETKIPQKLLNQAFVKHVAENKVHTKLKKHLLEKSSKVLKKCYRKELILAQEKNKKFVAKTLGSFFQNKRCQAGAKQKKDHTSKHQEKTEISPELLIADTSAVQSSVDLVSYKVERLIGRRISKISKTTEFLVQLENTQEITEIRNFEKEENGAWWVPFSHFAQDLMTCNAS